MSHKSERGRRFSVVLDMSSHVTCGGTPYLTELMLALPSVMRSMTSSTPARFLAVFASTVFLAWNSPAAVFVCCDRYLQTSQAPASTPFCYCRLALHVVNKSSSSGNYSAGSKVLRQVVYDICYFVFVAGELQLDLCVIAKQDDTDVNLKIQAVDACFFKYCAVRTYAKRTCQV